VQRVLAGQLDLRLGDEVDAQALVARVHLVAVGGLLLALGLALLLELLLGQRLDRGLAIRADRGDGLVLGRVLAGLLAGLAQTVLGLALQQVAQPGAVADGERLVEPVALGPVDRRTRRRRRRPARRG
jgi:hypothetical protein